MQKELKMGEIKVGIYFLYTLGYGAWVAGILANLDNVKSLILFLAGLIFAGFKIYNLYLDTIKKRDDMREERRVRKLNNSKVDEKL